MYKPMIALLCCIFTCHCLLAQTKEESAVATRMEAMRNAMLKPDSAVLADIAADDLTYGHSTGLIEDKAAFVADIITGKTVFTSLNFTEQTIKITGSIALVRNRFLAEINNNNAPKKIDIIVLLVWRKQKGEWKLLARQAAKIPPAS